VPYRSAAGYPDVLCFVLDMRGEYLVNIGRDGMHELEESLRLALEANRQRRPAEHTAA
jgi:hypothetical protein